MKILVYTPSFYPNIGGIELNSERLARQFFRFGHEVKLVCTTQLSPSNRQEKTFPFSVVRYPSLLKLLSLTIWCDVFWCPCISLKTIWLPLLFVKRPVVASHHMWYRRANSKRGWQDWLKCLVTFGVNNISISQSIADDIPSSSKIIENSYNSNLFYTISEVPKDKALVFLGRLVSDKGADLLLESLHRLKQEGLSPSLTIIGSGPEQENLEKQAKILGLTEQVDLVGQKTGRDLLECLNSHRIMVVPSRRPEPFGVVALEGIASGCAIVGSEQGGLKNAIGPCGMTFPNGDTEALTKCLADLLRDPKKLANYRSSSASHLEKYHLTAVAKAYLEFFETTLK